MTMRGSPLPLLMAVLVLAVVADAQSRSDDFDATGYASTSTTISPLPDGGCAVRWCGELASVDAGTVLRGCTANVEIQTPANITRCNVIAAAGTGRVLRELRFNVVDAGVP